MSEEIMTSSSHLNSTPLDLEEVAKVPGLDRRTLLQAEYDFGVNRDSFALLVDRKNWISPRPQIRVFARINQKDSFAVRWLPAIGRYDEAAGLAPEFDRRFVREVEMAEGINSSLNLLMWFRQPPQALPDTGARNLRDAMLSIASGLRARYDRMVQELGQQLSVASATSLTIVSRGNRIEYQFGSEGCSEQAASDAKGLAGLST